MAEAFDGIDERLAEWIAAQPLFFVATAPMSADGHVNCSPKGLPGTFAVLDENEVAYLDLTGSGAETIAHVKENGRIVIMFCAFTKRPRIVRLHGTARVVEAGSAEFSEWPIGSPITSAPARSCASPWTGCPTPAVTASRQWSSFASARTCP